MSGYYDRQGNELTMKEWATLFEDFENNRVVAQTHVGHLFISTVWLGLDHSFGHGPPAIFETMVFDHSGKGRNPYDGFDMERYATEAGAMEGHKRMVRKYRWKRRRKWALMAAWVAFWGSLGYSIGGWLF